MLVVWRLSIRPDAPRPSRPCCCSLLHPARPCCCSLLHPARPTLCRAAHAIARSSSACSACPAPLLAPVRVDSPRPSHHVSRDRLAGPPPPRQFAASPVSCCAKNACCKRMFQDMFQVFCMDVTKIDLDVAHIAMAIHVCCKSLFKIRMLQLFHLSVAKIDQDIG
jgi:hypothetical protein